MGICLNEHYYRSSGDSEFVQQLLRHNEDFVVQQVAEMRKVIGEQKKSLDHVTKTIEELERRESMRTPCNCTAQVKRAMEAPIFAMDAPNPITIVKDLVQTDLANSAQSMSSMPNPAKRSKATCTATSADELITDIDLLENEEFREHPPTFQERYIRHKRPPEYSAKSLCKVRGKLLLSKYSG